MIPHVHIHFLSLRSSQETLLSRVIWGRCVPNAGETHVVFYAKNLKTK